MQRLVFFALFFPLCSFGDDPFACVSPETKQAFLPGYPDAYEYSTNLPVGFVDHAVPPSSTLIGSQRNSMVASVVYAVDGDVNEAVDAVVSSIVERGWSDLGESPGMTRGGFQTMEYPRFRQLCHEDGRTVLTVGGRNTAAAGLVTLSTNAGMRIRSCDELTDRNRFSYRHMSLANEMPNLKLPEGVQSTNQGSGGGGDEYDTHITVSTEMSRQSLAALLDDQIRDQGWSLDASWSGNRSVGSTWTKESGDGDPLVGMLHAYGGNESTYSLQFSIRLDAAQASAGGNAVGIRFE